MPKLLLAALCDDVRREIGGKNSLMGLFDSFNVVDFQQPLPQFHVFGQLGIEDEGQHAVAVVIQSQQADFRVQFQGAVDARTKNEALALHVCNIDIGIAGLRVPRPGVYHVSFVIDDQQLQGPTFQVCAVQPPMVQ